MINSTNYLGIIVFVILSCCSEKDTTPRIDYTGQLDSIIDIDGNQYRTIGIGTQIWMQQNLKVSRLNDGTKITLLTENKDWRNKSLNAPGFGWYANDSIINKAIYGGLYNFFAVETDLLCPSGWHVPSQIEWKTLVDFLGGKEIAGGKLKDISGEYWIPSNYYIDNDYDFHGLPGGFRFPETGESQGLGFTGWWWTNQSSKDDPLKSLIFWIGKEANSISEENIYKNGGASVRCIKDQ